MSEEFICKVLPLVGLGTREHIKAGHAALVLIENSTGSARYYDFGRYVTPKGLGRVRGVHTDAELEIPFSAEIATNQRLKNLPEFLIWLEANSDKTHGEGRLVASVCEDIDFEKAEAYIDQLQQRGSIPYGAFDKTGSNCARFVTDTILASTANQKICKALHFNKRFTPSTVGNVEKSAYLGAVYEVLNGEVSRYDSSALKENLTNYFDRSKGKEPADNSVKEVSGVCSKLPAGAQQLLGIGSSASFFLTVEEGLPQFHVRIRRYNDMNQVDFDGLYRSESFDKEASFIFTYDSNCAHCHVLQGGQKIRLESVGTYAAFSLRQKVRAV